MGLLREIGDLLAEEWMEIKTDVRKKRRNETRDLTHPIIYTLNRIQGVRVVRNNNLGPVVPFEKRHLPDVHPVPAGLGTGSADIVGIVRCSILYRTADDTLDPDEVRSFYYGRAFALEVKWPGIRPKDDQLRWMTAVRRLGGFAAVVHSVDEAIEAVDRCRKGLDQ